MTGLRWAFLAALISGVSIFVNAQAIRAFPDEATLFTTLKNALVGAALVAIVAFGARGEVVRLGRRQWAGLAAIGVVGGSVPFILFFEGLSQATSAGGAGFIHKTLFVWVAVLALAFLPRERLGAPQLAAIAVLLGAQLLLGPLPAALGQGELLVLAATLLWSAEVVIARRLMASVSSRVAAAGRMGIGAVLMLAYAASSGQLTLALDAAQWGWIALTGVLLIAFVSSWYAALERAPATAVTCVLTLGAPITAALALLSGRPLPPVPQLAAYALICLAVAMFLAFWRTDGRARERAAVG